MLIIQSSFTRHTDLHLRREVCRMSPKKCSSVDHWTEQNLDKKMLIFLLSHHQLSHLIGQYKRNYFFKSIHHHSIDKSKREFRFERNVNNNNMEEFAWFASVTLTLEGSQRVAGWLLREGIIINSFLHSTTYAIVTKS